MTDSTLDTELLDTIVAAMPDGARESARRCVDALHGRLIEVGSDVGERTVLVAYGGGKDSSYTIAFVRLVQLLHQSTFGTTFILRVITNRQPGMAREVLDNIARVYAALGMSHDPRCDLRLREGVSVRSFTTGQAPDPTMVRRYREDVLMAGHRAAGSGRPTFCNSCNFDMVGAFAAGIDGGTDVDMIITGDSAREQRMYQIWVRRLAAQVTSPAGDDVGFSGLHQKIAELSGVYFRDLHGNENGLSGRALPPLERQVRFFSIYDYTDYSAAGHWSFLTEFLGFRFDELAFNFTESDCANPLLMAHLRGLRVEKVHGRDYADGIAEYLSFGLKLMRHKEIPSTLIESMRSRYAGAENVARMRERARHYGEVTYGLSEEQLTCMVFSPFVDECAALGRYLQHEQPELVGRAEDIRAVLLGTDMPDDGGHLVTAIERMSGLSLVQARHLAGKPAIGRDRGPLGDDLITRILRYDPHKELIDTADGQELISGR